MKPTFLIAFLLCIASSLFGQGTFVGGLVTDQEEDMPLPGAHVVLIDQADQSERATVTSAEGRFRFNDAKAGSYLLKISFLGFEEHSQTVEVGNSPVFLGKIQLGQAAIQLEGVEVKEQTLPAIQLGDTTQFNAEAFKVNPDASAEDLVRKMPGVVVSGGKVQAQGEDIKEVLVDGKPFFGNDPTAALRNLPAEVIDKVQVFDQKSEQAQFSGVEDGQTSKTLNIITKPTMRSGQFGKLYAGYGYEDKYQVGGILNFFNADQRISIIGQSNNINLQNFATEDLLGVVGSSGRGGWRGRGGRGGGSIGDFLVSQRDGISTTNAIGLNYADDWGKKIKATGSYFFNLSENEAAQEVNREYIDDEEVSQFYVENTESSTRNLNHRLNFRMEYQIDSFNSIILRPRLTLQQNEGSETTFGQTLLGSDPLNQSNYQFNPDLSALNFSNDLLLRHRFRKEGRTISLNLDTEYNQSDGESFLYSENSFFGIDPTADTLQQFSDLQSDGWQFSSDLTYTEPWGKRGSLNFSYQASLERSTSDKRVFDFAEADQDYTDPNDALSNVFQTDYLTQRGGLGYRLNGQDYNIGLTLNYQWATLDNERTFPTENQFERDFRNWLPFAFLRYNFSKTESLRVFYRTSTNPPSVDQLQDVIDNSNPLQLRAGNPDLAQNYQHSLFIRYSSTNTEKSTNFFALFGGSFTQDYVANSTLIANSDTLLAQGILLQRGAQLTSPVNLDGNYSLRSYVTYGLPAKFLRSNVNFNLSGTYNRQPGLLNGDLNYSNNTNLAVGITLASNISEKLDFTLSSRTSYNWVRNTLATGSNNNYLNQNSEATLNWIFGNGFVLRTGVNHQYYDGLSAGIDPNYWLWNAAFAKKLFKDQRGELQLSVYDLLGQNTSISRSVNEVYIEDTTTDVLQRYVMLTFTYQLRNFGKGSPQSQDDDNHPPRPPHWGPRPGGF